MARKLQPHYLVSSALCILAFLEQFAHEHHCQMTTQTLTRAPPQPMSGYSCDADILAIMLAMNLKIIEQGPVEVARHK
jgi:hypothetical protein